jgi:hypothetical protein
MLGLIIGACVAAILMGIIKYFLDRSKVEKLEDAALPGLAEALRERAAKAPVTREEEERPDGKFVVTFRSDCPEDALVKVVAENLKREIAKWFNLRGLDAAEAHAVVTCPAALYPALEAAFADTVLDAPRIKEFISFGGAVTLARAEG